MTWLCDSDFASVITHAPLVSIDLIVEDEQSGECLLGWRHNRPAQGHWFVPGGRILKNERVQDAFSRLAVLELGVAVPYSQASWLGLYEHLYDDCVFGDVASTHYVVLAHKLTLPRAALNLPLQQHDKYCWLARDELLALETVHPYTKDYFKAASICM
jgi:colanic acid biosynthesis protein WcaH